MVKEDDKGSINGGNETSGEGGAAAECNDQSASGKEGIGERSGERRSKRGRPRKEKKLDSVVILNEIDPPKEVEIVLPNSDEEGRQKKRKSKSKKEKSLEIEKIISTISNLIAMRQGFEIWKLSNEEVKQLSEPIENMIKKSDFMTKMGEHSDAIALSIACGTIFLPRAIMQIELNKKNKKGGLKDGKNIKRDVFKNDGSGQKIQPQNNTIPNENDMRSNDCKYATINKKYDIGICDVIHPIY